MNLSPLLASKPILSVITWGSAGTTILSIIHVINPVVGAMAGCVWLATVIHKFQKEKAERHKAEYAAELERMKLEDFKRKHLL